jgi:hypothetical protein
MMLKCCNEEITIPDPAALPPPWAVSIYTDAAGGTLEALGRGSGGVLNNNWFYLPWSKAINSGGHKVGGKKVSRKLAALELIGPLVAISAWFDLLRHNNVIIWVDNAGSVGVWNKG